MNNTRGEHNSGATQFNCPQKIQTMLGQNENGCGFSLSSIQKVFLIIIGIIKLQKIYFYIFIYIVS